LKTDLSSWKGTNHVLFKFDEGNIKERIANNMRLPIPTIFTIIFLEIQINSYNLVRSSD